MIARWFGLEAAGSSVRNEFAAGLTTFLTMSYIIFVNPDILSKTGMDRGALVTATILASVFGTLAAGLWANVPFAMAPGMGLNAFFAYSLVLGGKASWQTALGVVFVSGVVFLALACCGVRQRLTRAIPLHLRLAIGGGIGLFITFIGLQNLGLIVSHPATMVTLGKFSKPLALGLAGLAVAIILETRRVPGAMLISIILTTIAAMTAGHVKWPDRLLSSPPSLAPIFCKMDILSAFSKGTLGAVFSLMFMDLFDSIGTIVACAHEARMVEADGSIRRLDQMLRADALATMAGAALGTSTTTTYIESGAGIAAGGRTGLTSVVVAGLFLAALFFSPFIALVPSCATAPALIIVGIYMFKHVRQIDFSDVAVATPSFLVIILMPLTYSISTALAFGFLSFIVIETAAGRIRGVHPVMWIVGVLSLADVCINMA